MFQWLRAQAPRVPTPDPSFLVGSANETEPSVLAYCRLPRNTRHLLFSSFTPFRSLLTSAFYGLGSKVALSGVAPPSGCGYARLAWAVVIREALSPYALPLLLLPPPAGWVRCKAHHHPPLRVHQVASGGTATGLHEISRAPTVVTPACKRPVFYLHDVIPVCVDSAIFP